MRFKISCHVEAITCLSISIVLLSDIVICISIFLLRFYAMLTLMNWDPVFGFAPCLALALGIYSCITSAYGCVIICSRHRGILAFFAVLTTVAFIAQVVSILLFLQLKTKIDKGCCPPSLAGGLNKYDSNDTVRHRWDTIQMTYTCCGPSSYDGWEKWLSHRACVPDSCCHDVFNGCASSVKTDMQQTPSLRERAGKIINKHGCKERIQKIMSEKVMDIIYAYYVIGIVLALIKIIVVVLTCSYIAKISRQHQRDRKMISSIGNMQKTVSWEVLQVRKFFIYAIYF